MVSLTPAPLERQPVPARKRRGGCIGGCPWDCDDVSADEREEIFQSFWGHQREQTEEAIQSCQHEECRFHWHRCVSEGACNNSASYNRKATAQPPEGDAVISQREKVWDRGEVFSRPAAASQLRHLWDTANAERPSVDFSWPRFCWVPSKYELDAGCYNGKAKYEELQKAPSLHSTSSARWIKEAVFWHVSRLIALPLHLHQYSSFFCPETEKQSFLHHLSFFYYVQSPETKSLLNFIFITFLFISMVFCGAFTAHATIRPVFHHSLPGRLITDSPAKLKQPSKSFHFLLEWIIAFAIVCEKNDHKYPICSFLWAREQSTKNAEEYWTGSRKKERFLPDKNTWTTNITRVS